MDVEIISKESIKPSSPTPNHLKTFNLCVLDQLISTPYAPIIFYYPNNNGDNIFQALQRSLVLKKSLSETLTQFYPLAGTIKNNLSIDCNDVGANYVLALVHGRLDGFLRQPDHRLINKFLPFIPSFDESSAGARVTNVQVNIFECGGIAVGLCVSHKILDGAGLHTFLKGWANMASGNEEVVYPNLTAPSIFPAKSLWLRDVAMVVYQSMLKEGRCTTRRFVFDPNAIAALKAEAGTNGVQQQPTRVEVVSALIWKCAITASKEASGLDKTSRLTHFVNLQIGSVDIYNFTSWCNMGFYDIDFGWGKPSWVTGYVSDGIPVFLNLVSLMDTNNGGIEAWVNLNEEEMKILLCNQELLSYASLDPSPI
ncbi:hypothetical protein E3N88_15204 [Mikania micrantha]|uniref:Uncharacterized protein n=1 Tax=Mikania micrantha TaxID=192012 RepID=A0A5N6NUZ5_9ASTR|nr:hypothetical protein E3N88_15204 [Mikania micrantha]